MKNCFKQHSDQELIFIFQSGNEAAIGELIERYQSNVYTAIYLMVKDKYLAEDLFQDTFLKIALNIRKQKYAEQGKFLPWALRIAHNLCIDYFRKAKQKLKVTLSDGSDIFSTLPFEEKNAVQRMETEQTEQTVQQLLLQLPEEQQEVVLMRIYGDMSFKEIAELTGVSINTALGRMRYALINLRKMIMDRNLVLR